MLLTDTAWRRPGDHRTGGRHNGYANRLDRSRNAAFGCCHWAARRLPANTRTAEEQVQTAVKQVYGKEAGGSENPVGDTRAPAQDGAKQRMAERTSLFRYGFARQPEKERSNGATTNAVIAEEETSDGSIDRQ